MLNSIFKASMKMLYPSSAIKELYGFLAENGVEGVKNTPMLHLICAINVLIIALIGYTTLVAGFHLLSTFGALSVLQSIDGSNILTYIVFIVFAEVLLFLVKSSGAAGAISVLVLCLSEGFVKDLNEMLDKKEVEVEMDDDDRKISIQGYFLLLCLQVIFKNEHTYK